MARYAAADVDARLVALLALLHLLLDHLRAVETRNEADSTIYNTEKQLMEHKAAVPQEDQDAIKAATSNSVDRYTTEKTLYEQHRQWEVTNGAGAIPADGPTLADEGPSVASKPTQQ